MTQGEIPNITNFAPKIALNAVENKISNVIMKIKN